MYSDKQYFVGVICLRFSESQLSSWCNPASTTEEEKINNSINMIKDAIKRDENCRDLEIDIFVQGSYANNTNVKQRSDVDVCIMNKEPFFTNYPEGLKASDYGFTSGGMSYDDYKKMVVKALKNKFGENNVVIGNKSVKIKSNTYHVEADAVIAYMLRDYASINSRNPLNYVEGIRYYASYGGSVTNYPKEHIKNGTQKNINTNYYYKKLVRILKRVRNQMVEERKVDGDIITSFLIECLVWNVPNNIITGSYTWTERVKKSIIHLYNEIKENKHIEWGEVSERLYLFKCRKWSDSDVLQFLIEIWNYMGYADENN